jgi:hypothetical protein
MEFGKPVWCGIAITTGSEVTTFFIAIFCTQIMSAIQQSEGSPQVEHAEEALHLLKSTPAAPF